MSADAPLPFAVSAQSTTTLYRSVRKIASGGMGSVELAVAASGRSLGRMVAVKRLHPHLAEDERFLSMFFDELAITASLHHPHIVEIVDWGRDEQGHFLVLEYVPGDSLFALARATQKRGIPFPVELALYIVACTAEGLHAAHEVRDERGESRHLVHRDVSHSNVLVGIHGQVTLIDFGVAKARDNLTHTVTGTLKGKFGYLSPEQARGETLDRRSDLFSLGVLLWELLSGQRLFHGATEWESMRRTLEQDAPALHPDWPEVPAAVDEVLARALAKSRDTRPATCLDLADALRAVARAEGYTAGEDELARFFREALPERVEELERVMVVAQASVEEATAILRGLPVGADTVVTPPPTLAAPAPRLVAPAVAAPAPSPRAWLRLGLPAALVVAAALAAYALRPLPPPAVDRSSVVQPVTLAPAAPAPVVDPMPAAPAPAETTPPAASAAAPARHEPSRRGPPRRLAPPTAVTPPGAPPVAPRVAAPASPPPAATPVGRPQLDQHW